MGPRRPQPRHDAGVERILNLLDKLPKRGQHQDLLLLKQLAYAEPLRRHLHAARNGVGDQGAESASDDHARLQPAVERHERGVLNTLNMRQLAGWIED